MYGLKPTDIEYLIHLRDADITQICVGAFDIQFHFHPKGNVSVTGRCELLDATGQIIDLWEEKTCAGSFRFPEILKSPVTDVSIDTPRSFVLKFENKMSLRVVDNSDRYESFSVDNLYI